jgi:hypothetical protein
MIKDIWFVGALQAVGQIIFRESGELKLSRHLVCLKLTNVEKSEQELCNLGEQWYATFLVLVASDA